MVKDRYPSKVFRSGARVDVPIHEQFRLCDMCEKQNGDHSAPQPTPTATSSQCDEWNLYLKNWHLDYPCKMTIDARLDRNSHLRIWFLFHNEPDATDPNIKIDAITTGNFLAPSILPDYETPRWIRANILHHLNHELDEHLHYGGIRPFDPHIDALYTCSNCLPRSELESLVRELFSKAKESNLFVGAGVDPKLSVDEQEGPTVVKIKQLLGID